MKVKLFLNGLDERLVPSATSIPPVQPPTPVQPGQINPSPEQPDDFGDLLQQLDATGQALDDALDKYKAAVDKIKANLDLINQLNQQMQNPNLTNDEVAALAARIQTLDAQNALLADEAKAESDRYNRLYERYRDLESQWQGHPDYAPECTPPTQYEHSPDQPYWQTPSDLQDDMFPQGAPRYGGPNGVYT